MSHLNLWQRLIRWLQPAPATRHPRHTPDASLTTGRESSRQQRAAQREKLHALVRESMIRSGVLSGAYKFKSLPLDRTGQSFIVLFDLDATAMACDAQQQAEWETLLQTLAQDRLHIEVKSVYWRTHPIPATRDAAPHPTTHSHPNTTPSRRPDFAPTQPMDPAMNHDAHHLSPTQPGQLE
jgi:hypothetical protein